MLLRQATMADLPQIYDMVMDGRQLLAMQFINQWQKDYPNMSILAEDIQQGNTLVLVQENEVLGSAALVSGSDPTYQEIFDGQWLTMNADYLAIHRVSVAQGHHGEGISERLLRELIREADQVREIESVRIDTHPQNKAMQYVIEKCGFVRTGSVNLAATGKPETDNFAYERLTSNVKSEDLSKLLVD